MRIFYPFNPGNHTKLTTSKIHLSWSYFNVLTLSCQRDICHKSLLPSAGGVMRDAPDQKQALKRVNRLIEEWSVTYPDLAAWLEETIVHALAVFALPASRRKRLRTTNWLKRFQLGSHPIFLPCVILLQIEYKVM